MFHSFTSNNVYIKLLNAAGQIYFALNDDRYSLVAFCVLARESLGNCFMNEERLLTYSPVLINLYSGHSFVICSKWKCSSDEESDSSSGDEAFRVTEYYKDNPKLPVYTKKTEVLGPLRVVNLLRSVGTSLPISVACIQQPIHVEHHRTFIVDTEALKSIEDLKCDDCDCWFNNRNKKFRFVVDKGGNVSKDVSKEMNGPAVVLTLKREYFCLKDGILNDFRKRTDVIYGRLLLTFMYKGFLRGFLPDVRVSMGINR